MVLYFADGISRQACVRAHVLFVLSVICFDAALFSTIAPLRLGIRFNEARSCSYDEADRRSNARDHYWHLYGVWDSRGVDLAAATRLLRARLLIRSA